MSKAALRLGGVKGSAVFRKILEAISLTKTYTDFAHKKLGSFTIENDLFWVPLIHDITIIFDIFGHLSRSYIQ